MTFNATFFLEHCNHCDVRKLKKSAFYSYNGDIFQHYPEPSIITSQKVVKSSSLNEVTELSSMKPTLFYSDRVKLLVGNRDASSIAKWGFGKD